MKAQLKRVLCIGSHPDDIEIGCLGTALTLQKQGYELFSVCVTSGDAGDKSVSKEQLSKTREAEAQAAGKLAGVKQVRFLRYPDGLTHFTETMRIEVINLIREIKPEILFVHAASDSFPDHRVVHQLVKSAIVGAAGPWFQQSEGEPHLVPRVYGYEVWHPICEPQLTVDITDVMEQKIAALRCHKSQMQPVAYDEAVRGLNRYRGVTSFKGQYAEAFEVIRTSV